MNHFPHDLAVSPIYGNANPQTDYPYVSKPVTESPLLLKNATKPCSFHGDTLIQERHPNDKTRYTHNGKDFPNTDDPKSPKLFSAQLVPAPSSVSSNCVPKRISGTCKKGPKGANLFVYHLPSEVDNEDLITLFSFFGPLLSVRVKQFFGSEP